MAKAMKVGPAGRPDRRPNPGKQFRFVKTGWPEEAARKKVEAKAEAKATKEKGKK